MAGLMPSRAKIQQVACILIALGSLIVMALLAVAVALTERAIHHHHHGPTPIPNVTLISINSTSTPPQLSFSLLLSVPIHNFLTVKPVFHLYSNNSSPGKIYGKTLIFQPDDHQTVFSGLLPLSIPPIQGSGTIRMGLEVTTFVDKVFREWACPIVLTTGPFMPAKCFPTSLLVISAQPDHYDQDCIASLITLCLRYARTSQPISYSECFHMGSGYCLLDNPDTNPICFDNCVASSSECTQDKSSETCFQACKDKCHV